MQNLEQVVEDLVTENAALQCRVQEVTELQQQLTRKEAELTRAEETIRREQQQRRQVSHCVFLEFYVGLMVLSVQESQLVQAKERELAQAQQQIRNVWQYAYVLFL